MLILYFKLYFSNILQYGSVPPHHLAYIMGRQDDAEIREWILSRPNVIEYVQELVQMPLPVNIREIVTKLSAEAVVPSITTTSDLVKISNLLYETTKSGSTKKGQKAKLSAENKTANATDAVFLEGIKLLYKI